MSWLPSIHTGVSVPVTTREFDKRIAPLSSRVPLSYIGGMRIARLSRDETARLMSDIASGKLTGVTYPVFMTSSNGQVLSMYASSPEVRALYDQAEVISADGQPMVLLSRLFSRQPLPERCSTTDLYHEVSKVVPPGTTYYLFGAKPDELKLAVEASNRLYPHINVIGYCHGYISEAELENLFAELEAKKPDILWVGLGVPAQQRFVVKHRQRLSCVKVVKTCGGLFDFLSETRARAPAWMRAAGLEWLYRISLEPRRLLVRYLVTNPHSLYLLITKTR